MIKTLMERMRTLLRRKKPTTEQEPPVLSFLDCITPSALKFETDHYICDSTYRCVWALREYPATTETQALLSRLGDRRGVTLHIYCRTVSPSEENRIIHNAANRNRLERTNTNDLRRVVTAESNLQDMATLLGTLDREHEPLVYCAVYIGLCADSYEALQLLKTSVEAELLRCKLTVDKLLLRQQEGFRAVQPAGFNALGMQFQRVLPASSVANLYPFNYSGKADPRGFYIGKDKFGSNIVVDFDRRDSDKTSANILILDNSGQGKSYLMKLLICNLLEAGKSIISLDAEHELDELCGALNGCFIDLMAGEHHINVLEVKCWDESGSADDNAPNAFCKSTLLARHISFLRDFFRAYKDFSDPQFDTIEIMLERKESALMGNRKQPFGYKMEWGCIVPHPQEAEMVGYIYRQYLAGASFKTLTETLREQSVPYDMGKAWNKNMVARILEDSRYTGTNRSPALITQEQFDAVQQRRQRMCPQKRQTEAQKELRKLCGAVPPVSVQRKVLQLLNTLIEGSERMAVPPRSPTILPRYELDAILVAPPVDEERARRLALDHAGAALSGISAEAFL